MACVCFLFQEIEYSRRFLENYFLNLMLPQEYTAIKLDIYYTLKFKKDLGHHELNKNKKDANYFIIQSKMRYMEDEGRQ